MPVTAGCFIVTGGLTDLTTKAFFAASTCGTIVIDIALRLSTQPLSTQLTLWAVLVHLALVVLTLLFQTALPSIAVIVGPTAGLAKIL